MKRWCLLIAVSTVATLASCAKSEDPAQGSQTHFLARCEASCPAPYDCLCGVCTLACQEDQACTAEADGAQCVPPASACDATDLCDVTCTHDSDCDALSDEHACEEGRCRAPVIDETGGGAGGAGGEGGAAGEAGAAGTTSGTGGASGMGVEPVGEICDGSDDIRLGYTAEGGQVETTYAFTNPFGHSFLFIDGQCNYYASRNYAEGMFVGQLTPDQASALANGISWSDIEAMAAAPEVESCPDAGEVSIWAQSQRVMCTCACDPGPRAEQKSAALQAIYDLMVELVESGTPATTPVLAIADDAGPVVNERSWPLEVPMLEVPNLVRNIVDSASVGNPAVFDDPADAAALRMLRTAPDFRFIEVVDEGIGYHLFIRDDFPSGVQPAIDEFLMPTLP